MMRFVNGVAKEDINTNGITGSLTVTVGIAFATASMAFTPTPNAQSNNACITELEITENNCAYSNFEAPTFEASNPEVVIPINNMEYVTEKSFPDAKIISQTINAQLGNDFGIIRKEIVAKEEPTVLDKLISKRDTTEKLFSSFGYISSALILTPSIFGGIHWAVTIPPALIILSLPISIKLRQKMREVINDS